MFIIPKKSDIVIDDLIEGEEDPKSSLRLEKRNSSVGSRNHPNLP